MKINKWNVALCVLDPVEGSEQTGICPCVIISNNSVNQYLPVATIMPLTKMRPNRKIHPFEVLLRSDRVDIKMDSICLVYQIRTIDQTRVKNVLSGIDDPKYKKQIEDEIKSYLID